MLIVPAFRGFHFSVLVLNINVFLRQGAKGPLDVPGIHLLLSPHHPQFWFFTQSFGVEERTSQLTFKTPKF
jgi:hypothetical protein